MTPKLLTVSPRGQITIPPEVRKAMGSRYLECVFDGKNLTLRPMQTREEFFAELDAAAKDYKKNGGFTLEEVKAKYGL